MNNEEKELEVERQEPNILVKVLNQIGNLIKFIFVAIINVLAGMKNKFDRAKIVSIAVKNVKVKIFNHIKTVGVVPTKEEVLSYIQSEIIYLGERVEGIYHEEKESFLDKFRLKAYKILDLTSDDLLDTVFSEINIESLTSDASKTVAEDKTESE